MRSHASGYTKYITFGQVIVASPSEVCAYVVIKVKLEYSCNKYSNLIGQLEVQYFTCRSNIGLPKEKKMHSSTVALFPGQTSWLQLLYSKSVRDLIQWSLHF